MALASATRRSAPMVSNATLVMVAGALILSAAMGVRQTFGLYLAPFALERAIPVTQFALAIALHNLVWGVAQPFAGAAADRYGAAPVAGFGVVALAAGLALAAFAGSGGMLIAGIGLLVGIGISCTSFGVVLAAVGRAVSAERRSMAMGIASAGGSLGQVLMVPVAQTATELAGLTNSLLVLAAIVLLAAPLGLLLDRRDATAPAAGPAAVPLGEALTEAARHRGFQLLTLGFFTCGFQLAFIATYLPGYLTLCHMPPSLGATALALIGLFNMAGSWACGWLGGRFRQQYVLGWLYLIRGAAIAVFLALPPSTASVVIFAAVMGLTWLGTVPLTSGLVAKFFGLRHLGTLFGVCFLSHQVGSFLGAWLGGAVFDATGSYTFIWAATAAAGLVAALLHFAIKDRPGDGSSQPAPPQAMPASA
ncbi:MFS transporter [Chelatococcus reniformis]|uniref:MFS transporter n=1 Tax=Chelatococcus reniformis TaxID=1494448 RepID=A0A916UMD5_9HYPH|nr:MFS transporter [Chelatococcus reniformis]GGC77178.1 MFS transporter [Chelatococcus reniformis]